MPDPHFALVFFQHVQETISPATHEPTTWMLLAQSSASLLGLAFALLLLGLFYRDIKQIVRAIAWRIKVGAQVRLGTVEIGALLAVQGSDVRDSDEGEARKDDGERLKERKGIYHESRQLMLAHRLLRSDSKDQIFDIYIYIIPHFEGSLEGVSRVEYFFGPYWRNRVYVARNRFNGFSVRTSAYGPFLCTAWVYFSDNHVTSLSRYIDFEMGASAPAMKLEEESDRRPAPTPDK